MCRKIQTSLQLDLFKVCFWRHTCLEFFENFFRLTAIRICSAAGWLSPRGFWLEAMQAKPFLMFLFEGYPADNLHNRFRVFFLQSHCQVQLLIVEACGSETSVGMPAVFAPETLSGNRKVRI